MERWWCYGGDWGAGAHLIDGEHVEVGDVVLLGQLDPGAALLLVDQLADVLVDKLALLEGKGEEEKEEEGEKLNLIYSNK